MASGPRVLVLGGVGFVGRNLVSYLAKNKLASKITVADKVLPATANLNDEEKAIFESDLVSFKQANLAREATIDAVFDHDGGNYEYVINLAAATKYSQVDEVYKENIIELSRICAAAAKKHGAKRFIEVSTAQVYDSGKKASDESAKLKPWTLIAKASLEAEKAVAESGVPHVIVRPAIIYGKVSHLFSTVLLYILRDTTVLFLFLLFSLLLLLNIFPVCVCVCMFVYVCVCVCVYVCVYVLNFKLFSMYICSVSQGCAS